MSNKVCKSKNCETILPDGYKSKYCESCLNERAQNTKKGLKTGLSLFGAGLLFFITKGRFGGKK